MSKTSEKKLLLLSFDRWPSCSRFPKSANLAGFNVTTLAREGDPLHLSRFIDKRLIVPKDIKDRGKLLSLTANSFLDSETDFVIPCDEMSLRFVAAIYEEIKDSKDKKHKRIRALIVRSRGNPEYYKHLLSKKLTVELAQGLGIRTPEQHMCTTVDEVAEFSRGLGYPVVLKGEFGTAGYFVRICQDEQEALEGVKALRRAGQIIVQQYIDGIPAMANAVAYEGKSRACAMFSKKECYPDSKGPSAVVGHIRNEEMLKATQKFIKKTGYSGIISLDFILDKKGESYLIECNPRPTPVSHLGHVTGVDLFRSLYCTMTGQKYRSSAFEEKDIALFPKELARDNKSSYLYNAHHDVPWDEPRLVQYFLNTMTASASTSVPPRLNRRFSRDKQATDL